MSNIHNGIFLSNADGSLKEYANNAASGGVSDTEIEWVTKEQWDAMTPEQQSTGTYGVQGLGNPMNEDVLVAEVYADGIKTISEMLNELCSLALANNNTFDNSYHLVIYFNYSNNIQDFSYCGLIGSLYAFSLSHVAADGIIYTQCIRLGTSNSLFRISYINTNSTVGYINNDTPVMSTGKISLYRRR